MISMTVQPPLAHCPPWCSREHLPSDDDGLVHVGVDKVLDVNSGPEVHTYYVSVECMDGAAESFVRLEGSTSAPMTPAQALALSRLLAKAARAAGGSK